MRGGAGGGLRVWGEWLRGDLFLFELFSHMLFRFEIFKHKQTYLRYSRDEGDASEHRGEFY